MADSEFIDQMAEAFGGLAPDVMELVLDALADVATELGTLSHEEVVTLAKAAVTAAAGAAVKHHLDRRQPELDAAIRRALGT
jgi:hypothetical protein